MLFADVTFVVDVDDDAFEGRTAGIDDGERRLLAFDDRASEQNARAVGGGDRNEAVLHESALELLDPLLDFFVVLAAGLAGLAAIRPGASLAPAAEARRTQPALLLRED